MDEVYDFGVILQKLRKEKGFTQEQLAPDTAVNLLVAFPVSSHTFFDAFLDAHSPRLARKSAHPWPRCRTRRCGSRCSCWGLFT